MKSQNEIQKMLLAELGLSTLPQKDQEALLIKMTEVLLKRIFLETMEKLSDEDREAYGKLLDENSDSERVGAFLREKIADYDGMVRKVIDDFKLEMKQVE